MSFKPLEHQAAGHEGPLQSSDGSLFSKLTNKQEIEFYTNLQSLKIKDLSIDNVDNDENAGNNNNNNDTDSSSSEIQLGSKLYHWVPNFIGILTPGMSTHLKSQIQVDNNIAPQSIDGKMVIHPAIETQSLPSTTPSESTSQDKLYIVLSNSLHGYVKPSILDIKLGSILFDETANPEKKERMRKVSKETTSGSLNFRICGMKIINSQKLSDSNSIEGIEFSKVLEYQPVDESDEMWIIFNKFFGRSLNDQTVIQGLKLFFTFNKLTNKIRKIIINNFYTRLQILFNCLLDYEVRIIAGSLLFIYENDLTKWEDLNYEDSIFNANDYTFDEDDDEDEDEEEELHEINSNLSTLKFIDFAHSKFTPGESYDENIIKGVENLIELFKQLNELYKEDD
ncbi:kinase activity protein [[Candida] boidinii]|nr:kinase activity protein [[Candida] boidinii]